MERISAGRIKYSIKAMKQLTVQIKLNIKQSTFYTPMKQGESLLKVRCLPFMWAATLLKSKPKLLRESSPINQAKEITRTIVMKSLREEEAGEGIFHYPGTELQWTLVSRFSAFLSEELIIPYQKVLAQDKDGVIWGYLIKDYYKAGSILATYEQRDMGRVLLSTLQITEKPFEGIPVMEEVPIDRYLQS